MYRNAPNVPGVPGSPLVGYYQGFSEGARSAPHFVSSLALLVFVCTRCPDRLNNSMKPYGTLIFFCGKMGAGKSTLAAKIAKERGAVLLSEDEWLAKLFPGEVCTLNDYVNYSSRLRSVIGPLVEQMLLAGTTVVLDFPGNTRSQRAWFISICSKHGLRHQLYHIKAEDAVCLARLKQRRKEQPARAQFDTEEVFALVTRHFEPPSDSGEFNVVVVD